MVQSLSGINLIYKAEITFIGLLCLIESDFFVVCNFIIRNKSPPLKTYFSTNFKFFGGNYDREKLWWIK